MFHVSCFPPTNMTHLNSDLLQQWICSRSSGSRNFGEGGPRNMKYKLPRTAVIFFGLFFQAGGGGGHGPPLDPLLIGGGGGGGGISTVPRFILNEYLVPTQQAGREQNLTHGF